MTDLVAGEELDALIATKAMGWVWRELPTPGHYAMMADGAMGSRWFKADGTDTYRDKSWSPSTKILDAYAVLTWWATSATERQWTISRMRRPNLFYCALSQNELTYGEDYAETAELAVCSAVLKAVENS